jgi:hypoxanthine phosphoribosyltransferase
MRTMTKLLHVDPDEFMVDTFKLGREVYLSGFRPKHAISIWRGGTPVGLGVDAFYRSRGVHVSHTTIATDSYVGIAQQAEVTVKNLEHLVQVVCPEDGLLIIDDVYESGNTIRRVVELLRQMARANAPKQIKVAAVHHKPGRSTYDELPVIALKEIDADVWIDYPHELSDLVSADDPGDERIREKDEAIWRILREGSTEPREVQVPGDFIYVTPRDLLLDCIRLGVNIAQDVSFRPDFMIALWPGGVIAGLPVHEVYKYFLAKEAGPGKAPDHISVNTSPTRYSFRSQIIGIQYLEDHINKDDNILILDTTFRAGRLVNDVVMRLKEVLRRNLNHKRIRVASVYYNPDDRSTWTVRPDIVKPDYYLKLIREEVIYPSSVHMLPDPHRDLKRLNPRLWEVLYSS